MKRVCRCPLWTTWVFACVISCPTLASSAPQPGATIEVSDRAEFITAINQALPGTTIRIAPGEYQGGLSFSNLRGTRANPIVIEARDADQPPVIVGGGSGLQLRSPAYVQLRNLVLRGATGNGLNIDDSGSSGEPAQGMLLQNLQVRDVGPRGNSDGIKLSGIKGFVVQDCTIERWGDNGSAIDMVGCHEGEINGCLFRYRSDIFGNGVQTKGGTADIAVRRCRFEQAGGRAINLGGSTGRDFFRPRDANYEARNITVEDCTFSGSMSPIAFVGVDGATVRYNTFYRPTRWLIRILQETQAPEFLPCRNGVFANNLVAYRSDEVRTMVNVGGGTAPETFQFAGNHWFCIDNPHQSQRLGLPTTETNSRYGTDPLFRDPERGDFERREHSPVLDAGVRKPTGNK